MACLIVWHVGLKAQDVSETRVTTSVEEVTVFMKGAQVSRTKQLQLAKGEQLVVFTGLSPFVDDKSIQVKMPEGAIILGVNFKKDYLDASEKPAELLKLEAALEYLQDSIQYEKTQVQILNKQLSFLDNNQKVGGDNGLNLESLKQLTTYRKQTLLDLHSELDTRNKTLQKMQLRISYLRQQIQDFSKEKRYPSGEILVKVSSEKNISGMVSLSYLVENAGWFPSYDLRANDITQPMEIVYKANVFQDTKVDWKDVKISFSSANPSVSGVTPDLKPYYLGYYTKPPVYNLFENKIEGTVFDQYGEPLIGANILVKGTNIGTITDFDGAFSLQLPNDAKNLEITYVGFESKIVPIRDQYVNIVLDEGALLEEVVVSDYAQAEYAAAPRKQRSVEKMEAKPSTPAVQKMAKATTVSFTLEKPYSLSSSNKTVAVAMEKLMVPTEYQHFSIPKIQEKVFLKAFISDWEQYQLMEGEANIFLEGMYIGKTLLDTRFASDTLDISLGEDKSITIKREKAKNFKSRRLIGTNQSVAMYWDISIKNNKNRPVQLLVFDQVPVSQNKEIEVELLEKSNASLEESTGKLQWDLNIPAQASKNMALKYEVKYPKGKNLEVE